MVPGQPEKKPFIERFFRELNRFCATHPGATATREQPAGQRTETALKEARLTLDEFDTSLQRWRFDGYAHLPRRRVQSPLRSAQSPLDCWQDCAQRMYLPEPPTPEALLRIFMVKGEVRALHRYGIELHGVQYAGSALTDMLSRVGPGCQVEVRFDPTDIRAIAVLDPDSGHHVPVPAKAEGLPALSFAELQRLRKQTAVDPNTVAGVRSLITDLACAHQEPSAGGRKTRASLRENRRSERALRSGAKLLAKSGTAPGVATKNTAKEPAKTTGRLRYTLPTVRPMMQPRTSHP